MQDMLTILFDYFLPILTTLYALTLCLLTVGLSCFSRKKSSKRPFISIIVAARNEEQHIAALVQALLNQKYPDYEILIINDQSDDKTAEILASFRDKKLRVLTTENRDKVISPKKQAIDLGVQNANGEILLFTDADCLPPENWVSTMVEHFTPETGMVIGYSPYELPALKSAADYFLAIDSLSLAAVAAATSGLGYAATCSGRNLAYRKLVYEEVGGMEKIKSFISGDDDLFLKLVQQTDWKIRYAYDSRAVVPTELLTSPLQFFHQRIRHASKSFHYEIKKIIALACVYLFNLLIFCSFPLVIFNIIHVTVIWNIFAKAFFEFLFLTIFAIHVKRLKFIKIFPFAELLHVPYVVIFGALGPFKKFKWKDS